MVALLWIRGFPSRPNHGYRFPGRTRCRKCRSVFSRLGVCKNDFDKPWRVMLFGMIGFRKTISREDWIEVLSCECFVMGAVVC